MITQSRVICLLAVAVSNREAEDRAWHHPRCVPRAGSCRAGSCRAGSRRAGSRRAGSRRAGSHRAGSCPEGWSTRTLQSSSRSLVSKEIIDVIVELSETARHPPVCVCVCVCVCELLYCLTHTHLYFPSRACAIDVVDACSSLSERDLCTELHTRKSP